MGYTKGYIQLGMSPNSDGLILDHPVLVST